MKKSILFILLLTVSLYNNTFSWELPWQQKSMKVFSDEPRKIIADPKQDHDERAEKFMEVVQKALRNITHDDYVQVAIPDNGSWDCRKLAIGGRPNHELVFECRQKNLLATLVMLFSIGYDQNTVTTRTNLQKIEKSH